MPTVKPMVDHLDSSAGTPAAIRTGLCIHSFIEAQAARTPNQTAMICGEHRLTYAGLNARANQLARHLQSLGVGPETLVGLCLERSVDMAVGILGILKAGGAWLPLDPAYPKERLAYMLGHGRAPVLVTQSQLVPSLPPHAAQIVALDLDGPAIARHSAENFSTGVTPENLAYVIYTSGSTGQPKGVMISHANLAHYVQALGAPLGITAAARYLHTASISFSSSVRQLILPLSQGGTVVVATTALIRNPLALFAEIQRQRVTVLDLVPSYWRACLHALLDTDEPTRTGLLANDVQLILSASEPLPSDLPKTWRAKTGHRARIVNMFGQTEVTGIATLYPLPVSEELHGHQVPVGRPITGFTSHLLDAEGRPVPPGTIGEVHLSGPTVGRGYLHAPELTAEKFVPNPFPSATGATLYKLGDLAQQLPDGTLEFVGRQDGQIKIRGLRIEPGEVEAALHQHPAVRQSVVIAREAGPEEKQLVAYLAVNRTASPGVAELRAFLAPRLPDYMIPSAFVLLDALPLTPTGKIDRRALPAPDAMPATSVAPPATPLTATETKLAEIWMELLQRGQPAATDHFFEIGGQSLLATRMLSLVRAAFQVELTWDRLFASPTLAGVAQSIDTLLWMKNQPAGQAGGARDQGEI